MSRVPNKRRYSVPCAVLLLIVLSLLVSDREAHAEMSLLVGAGAVWPYKYKSGTSSVARHLGTGFNGDCEAAVSAGGGNSVGLQVGWIRYGTTEGVATAGPSVDRTSTANFTPILVVLQLRWPSLTNQLWEPHVTLAAGLVRYRISEQYTGSGEFVASGAVFGGNIGVGLLHKVGRHALVDVRASYRYSGNFGRHALGQSAPNEYGGLRQASIAAMLGYAI
jgi:hypothetical protein